jgi:hypothetical protein
VMDIKLMQMIDVIITRARPKVWHAYYVFTVAQIWDLVSWPELAYRCEYFYT